MQKNHVVQLVAPGSTEQPSVDANPATSTPSNPATQLSSCSAEAHDTSVWVRRRRGAVRLLLQALKFAAVLELSIFGVQRVQLLRGMGRRYRWGPDTDSWQSSTSLGSEEAGEARGEGGSGSDTSSEAAELLLEYLRGEASLSDLQDMTAEEVQRGLRRVKASDLQDLGSQAADPQALHNTLQAVAKRLGKRTPRGTNQQRGRVVLVDEHRTSRVSSAVNGQQPCERQLNKRRATRPADWKPPAGQVKHCLVRPAWSQQRDQPVRAMMWCPVVAPRKPPQAPRSSQEATQAAASEPGPNTPLPAKRSKRTKAEPAAEPATGKGKAAKAKPAPQPGRWLDRDCNAALNMQRIGESKWRPLELCWWPEQGKLPAKGKEYLGLGYKRVRDKPPKAQQQQPAVAQ
ncbi:hypothetical protein QJQ45_004257 [Haematococcus lacustris]|nr:hypothetical protein QJQ45_004257 [Haematococcus lacustris]